MRDAESLLDQIFAFHEGAITAESVTDLLGIVSKELFFKLDLAAKEGHLAAAFEIAHQVFSQGKDFVHFVESLIEHFRTLLLIKVADANAPFLTLTAADKEKYAASAKLYTQEQCLTILDFLTEALNQIRFTPSARTTLEALLLRILRIQQRIPVDFLVRQLNELEQALGKMPSVNVPPAPQSEEPTTPPKEAEKKTSAAKEPLPAPTPPPSVVCASMTVDPSPSPQDLGASANKVVKEVSASLPIAVEKTPPPLSSHTAEERAALNKKQSQYDTLLQFAAVELEGSLQKTTTQGF
jgi:DNA polymerase-3 subunit gamma/tau